ncbi:hypothetical protein AB0F71_32970 [Kitasatospora sp. NPDC028055]|uniref:hypothetical protein n=1 Tax=Kitasatospora sp. NPDC028055 TaxID=3155653 RepID=UPI0033D77E73
MSKLLPAQPGFAVGAAFADRSGEPRTGPVRGRVRPSGRILVALAGVAWVPYAVAGLSSRPDSAWFWGLYVGFLTMTVLPLAVPREPSFRRACLAVGWFQFGIEAVCSVPYVLLPLPVFVFAFPSGVMLLLAGRRDRGSVGTVFAALLVAGPIALLARGGWTQI